MSKPKLDKESPSLTPHGDILDVPGKGQAEKPAEKPDQDKQRPPAGDTQPRGDEPTNR